MTSSPRAGRPSFELTKSRLGQSLLRLHQSLDQGRQEDEAVETLLTSWQKRWATRRDEISRRLEMIERQLDHIGRPTERAPRLSLAIVHADSHR